MIEVFKTNISEISQAKLLVNQLLAHFPASMVNFDLQDCDNVLRVEGDNICAQKIITLLRANGYQCEPLP